MVDYTEEQLAEIEKAKKEAVEKALAEQQKKHNEDMQNLRVSAKAEKEKAVKEAEEKAKLTADEKAKKELEEKQKAEHEELEALRLEKKLNERKEKLVGAGVPEMFKNDSRLINAEDDKVDDVIETIKAEWGKIAPSGATTVTNVKGGGENKPEDKFAEFRGLGMGRKK